MITSIFTMDQRGGIGQAGHRPWQNASYVSHDDCAWFDELTRNQIVVMGANTWRAWNHRQMPLTGRKVAVFTHSTRFRPSLDVILCSGDVDREIPRLAESYPNKRIFVAGGADILKQTQHLCEEICVTRRVGSWRVDTKLDPEEYFREFRIHSVRPGAGCSFEHWKRSQKSKENK
jgi:dihydrofolate reductase